MKPLVVALAVLAAALPGRAAAGCGCGPVPTVSASPQWSATGVLAYARGGGSVSLREASLVVGSKTLVTVERASWLPFAWSPDGTRIAYVDEAASRLRVVRVADGATTDVAAAAPDAPSWSPDGTRIAFTAPGPSIAVANADGSGNHVVAIAATAAQWSPDGARIAFVATGGVGVVSAAGGEATLVAPGAREPRWSPDSTRLAVTVGSDVAVVDTAGTALRRLAPGSDPAWSPDGAEVALSSPDGDLVVVRADGSGARTVVASPMVERAPAWSPDGRRIAYENANQSIPGIPYGNWFATDVYVVDANGANRTELTGVCGFGPATPIARVCVVSGLVAEAFAPAARVSIVRTPLQIGWKYVYVTVVVGDADRVVAGAPVRVSRLRGPVVRVAAVTGEPLGHTTWSGRVRFRFERPRAHGRVVLRIRAGSAVRDVSLRV